MPVMGLNLMETALLWVVLALFAAEGLCIWWLSSGRALRLPKSLRGEE